MTTWTPLSEPYTASNGVTVTVLSSTDQMPAIGEHFRNALENEGFRVMIAGVIASGEVQIYETRDAAGGLVSCGELKVRAGKVFVDNDRAMHNGPGPAESKAAMAEYAEAVNGGAIALNLGIGESGFEDAPAPKP